MSVLGIDLAAGEKRTFACVLDWEEGALKGRLFRECTDETLLDLAKGRRKVAIDAPFGWPNDFVDALNAHRALEAWPAPDDGKPEVFRKSLSYRVTDRVVMHTRRPLSVSTDRLGVTAMRCAFLLHRWSLREPVDRTGRGKFVEVYPAGALVRWGLDASGYKGARREALGHLAENLLEQLSTLDLSDDDRRMCASSHDAFDALVAALVARASLHGLTDLPPRSRREQAAQEGWIHLPLWGSLPFVGLADPRDRPDPAGALAQALGEMGVQLTRGYTKSFDDAVLREFSTETKNRIRADLRDKGGSELTARSGDRPKFHAAHSSAALAANTFAPFLHERRGLPLGGEMFTGDTCLEAECRSGLRGTPPTLDCLVDGPDVLAVESKCLETFGSHVARFSGAYGDAIASEDPTWRAEYRRLVEDPNRYRHLDAAQLVKHYLGLRRTFADRRVTLAYLYWDPSNAHEVAACRIHAAELAEFERRVRDPELRFVAMSHRELWDEWASARRPAWLRRHAAELRRRYDVPV